MRAEKETQKEYKYMQMMRNRLDADVNIECFMCELIRYKVLKHYDDGMTEGTDWEVITVRTGKDSDGVIIYFYDAFVFIGVCYSNGQNGFVMIPKCNIIEVRDMYPSY